MSGKREVVKINRTIFVILFFTLFYLKTSLVQAEDVIQKVSTDKADNSSVVSVKSSGTPKEIFIIKNSYYNKNREEVQKEKEIIKSVQEPEKKTKQKKIPEREERSVFDQISLFFQPTKEKLPNFYIDGSFGITLNQPETSSKSIESTTLKSAQRIRNFDINNNYNNILTSTLALGSHFSNYTRGELEFINLNFLHNSYSLGYQRKTPILSSSFGAIDNLMGLNGNIIIDTDRRRRMYFSLGAGAGFANISFKDSNIKPSITFSYNAFLQFNFRINKTITIYARYKYINYLGKDFSVKDPIQMTGESSSRILTENQFSMNSFSVNTVSAGIRIYF
jgi:hypothetical protein